jgi:hypothetical protein
MFLIWPKISYKWYHHSEHCNYAAELGHFTEQKYQYRNAVLHLPVLSQLRATAHNRTVLKFFETAPPLCEANLSKNELTTR